MITIISVQSAVQLNAMVCLGLYTSFKQITFIWSVGITIDQMYFEQWYYILIMFILYIVYILCYLQYNYYSFILAIF